MVFADEPTGEVDSRSGAEVLGLAAQRAQVRSDGRYGARRTGGASYADQVVFVADGPRRGDEDNTTAQTVLDRMNAFEHATAEGRA